MRRISNLVPHRPGGSWSARDGWWDLLTGNTNPTNTQPPAYEELYPHQEADEDLALKKASLVRAVTDAALDQHFETMPSTSKGTPAEESLGDIRIGRKSISREQRERLRKQQAQKMKGLGSDRNLYFIWVSKPFSKELARYANWSTCCRFPSYSLSSVHGLEI
jgi:hypothetical protein